MTTDSRQQAKQIVDALYDNWKRLPSHPAVTEEQLEQALAATIEYRWAKHAMDRATARGGIDANKAAWDRACEAGPRLDEALSALGVEVDGG